MRVFKKISCFFISVILMLPQVRAIGLERMIYRYSIGGSAVVSINVVNPRGHNNHVRFDIFYKKIPPPPKGTIYSKKDKDLFFSQQGSRVSQILAIDLEYNSKFDLNRMYIRGREEGRGYAIHIPINDGGNKYSAYVVYKLSDKFTYLGKTYFQMKNGKPTYRHEEPTKRRNKS